MSLGSDSPLRGLSPSPLAPAALPPLRPAAAAAPQLNTVSQLLQARGESGWHFKLNQPQDKSQAETMLNQFQQFLGQNPQLLEQIGDLPHGQALLESLEAAAGGQLNAQHVSALQSFLVHTAGIDIGYGSSQGIDGLLGPRTLGGLQSFFTQLQQSDSPEASQAYLSNLELNYSEPQQSALPYLSLFDDDPAAAGSLYKRSPYHRDDLFVPAFGMAAYHESGVFRKPSDPYAAGAISRPRRRQDLGGKSYGTYQFQSSVYPDGSRSGNPQQSTLGRFVNWPGNPFGAELKAAASRHGLASGGFDQAWQQLARQRNKDFGEAQQAFLLHERQQQVARFMDRARLSPEVRNDPRIVDMIMGTTNHVGGLADRAADHLAGLQRGGSLSANEIGRALAEYKEARIASWFRSSPGAWNGLRNRFQDERTMFA